MAERGVAGRPGREGVWPALPRRSPASPPSPPVPLLWRGEQLSEGEPGSRAGKLLSGSGRRGEGGPRSPLLSIAVPSRPFSPCPTAGIAPRPRRWSARTAGPSGQPWAVEAAGPRRVGYRAGAGSRLSGCILGKASSFPRHGAGPALRVRDLSRAPPLRRL